ncbi:extracellular solute-binding protein [bacterium]|nr:extracellular solute-binding protein [bacterium]
MKRYFVLLSFVSLMIASACRNEPQYKGHVVIYTALDLEYSEPILKKFTKETGIEVRPKYDTEAAKTTGLVSSIIEESARPRCDVFWNNEILRTIQLQKKGLLEPYVSPNAASIPAAYKDPAGYWTGFAARLRVLAYNPKLVSHVPEKIEDLANPAWSGKAAMAYPLFGTTASHAAVLFSAWGPERAKNYFTALKKNDVRIVEGNMTACRMVADGEVAMAVVDTDDANLLMSEGKPVRLALLDQDGSGSLIVPNTVALIKGGPNPAAARKLIDYLLSTEVELALAGSPSAQIPLHAGVTGFPKNVEELAKAKRFLPDYAAAADQLQPSADFLKGLFTRK